MISMLIDYQSEAADARMDSIMLLEHLKVAIEVLEKVAAEYVVVPPYLQKNLAELKKTARDYDHKLKEDGK